MYEDRVKILRKVGIDITYDPDKLLINSLDKTKLDKIYSQSIQETKLALQKKSS